MDIGGTASLLCRDGEYCRRFNRKALQNAELASKLPC
jgi:hypothetical protein